MAARRTQWERGNGLISNTPSRLRAAPLPGPSLSASGRRGSSGTALLLSPTEQLRAAEQDQKQLAAVKQIKNKNKYS